MASRTLWAVIQTGTITPDADIVPFKTADGKRTPAILFTHEDYDKAARKRKRLATVFARFQGFGPGSADDLRLAMPVLGVVQVTMEEPAKRQKSSPPADTSANGKIGPDVPAATEPRPHGRKGRSQPQQEQAAA